MKLLLPVEVNENEILSAVFDNLWRASSPWIVEYAYGGLNEIVPVTYENPDGEGVLTKMVSKYTLLNAYKQVLTDGLYHCGEPVPMHLDDWDTCCADYVLQYALFGQCIYC